MRYSYLNMFGSVFHFYVSHLKLGLCTIVVLALVACDYLTDLEQPVITIIYPDEEILYNSTIPCTLEVTDNKNIDRVEISFGGIKTATLFESPYVSVLELPQGVWKGWTPRFKVKAYDEAGNWSEDEFNVRIQKGLYVVYPNGGEIWEELTTQTISWASVGDTGAYVALWSSTDGGDSWYTITSATENDGSIEITLADHTSKSIDSFIKIQSTSAPYFDLSDSAFTIWAPTVVNSIQMSVRSIIVDHSLAYIGGYYSISVYDISDVHNPLLLDSYYNSEMGSGIIAVGDGVAYHVRINDLWIFDVSTPNNISLIALQELPYIITDLVAVGSTLFATAEYDGLIIFDVANPNDISIIGQYSTSAYAQSVDIEQGLAYIATGHGGIQIVDVSNPYFPYLRGFYNTGASGIAVSGDIALVGFSSVYSGNTNVVEILDVSTPSAPVSIYSGYTIVNSSEVEIGGGIAFIGSDDVGLGSDYGGVQLMDISDPANPRTIGLYPQRFTIHYPVYELAVLDSVFYLCGGSDGFAVFDISGRP